MSSDVEVKLKLKDELTKQSNSVTNAFKQNMQEMTASATGLSSSLFSMAPKIAAVWVAFEGAKKAIAFLKDARLEAKELATANLQLTASLGYSSAALREQSDILSQKYKIDNALITSSQTQLSYYVQNENQLKRLTPAVMNFAAATGRDLASAAFLVARGIESENGQLRGLPGHFDGAAGSAERVNSVVEMMTKRFHDQADAIKDSKDIFDKMAFSFKEFKESAGVEFFGTKVEQESLHIKRAKDEVEKYYADILEAKNKYDNKIEKLNKKISAEQNPQKQKELNEQLIELEQLRSESIDKQIHKSSVSEEGAQADRIAQLEKDIAIADKATEDAKAKAIAQQKEDQSGGVNSRIKSKEFSLTGQTKEQREKAEAEAKKAAAEMKAAIGGYDTKEAMAGVMHNAIASSVYGGELDINKQAESKLNVLAGFYDSMFTMDKESTEKQLKNIDERIASYQKIKSLYQVVETPRESLKREATEDLQTVDEGVSSGATTKEDALSYKQKRYALYLKNVKKLDADDTQNKKLHTQQQIQMYSGLAQKTIGLANNITQIRSNNLATEKAKELQAVEDSNMSQKQKAKATEKINKEMAAKEKELKKEQQAWSISQAIINGALGITNIWSEYSENPVYAAALTVLEAATIATEIAIIKSQKFAKGGVVQGTGGTDSVTAQVTPNEVVMTPEQQANTLMAIARGSSSTSNSSENTNYHMGNIVVNGNADASTVRAIRQSQVEQVKQYQAIQRTAKRLRVAA